LESANQVINLIHRITAGHNQEAHRRQILGPQIRLWQIQGQPIMTVFTHLAQPPRADHRCDPEHGDRQNC
jgi:hypothetical protein